MDHLGVKQDFRASGLSSVNLPLNLTEMFYSYFTFSLAQGLKILVLSYHWPLMLLRIFSGSKNSFWVSGPSPLYLAKFSRFRGFKPFLLMEVKIFVSGPIMELYAYGLLFISGFERVFSRTAGKFCSRMVVLRSLILLAITFTSRFLVPW